MTFHDRRVLAGMVALCAVIGTGAGEGVSWAQACCASAGLIAPTRLRSYEDFAVGMAARGRSVFGAFDANGGYAGERDGDSEWNLEQDLFGVARLFERSQVAVLIPFLQTRRTLNGVAASGGGVGDVAVSARYDFIGLGEHRLVPGLAILAAAVLPTGTPPEGASDPWAAGATGQGSWQGTVGAAVEQAWEPYFVTVNGLVTWRSTRTVAAVKETFAPRLTAVLAVGRVLPRLSTVGLYASFMNQGTNSADGAALPRSGASSFTGGLAATLSPNDRWRLQGTLFTEVPVASWGKNETAGLGLSVSLLRVWP
ncbi:MAG: transporter [Polyangia bacterium]